MTGAPPSGKHLLVTGGHTDFDFSANGVRARMAVQVESRGGRLSDVSGMMAGKCGERRC